MEARENYVNIDEYSKSKLTWQKGQDQFEKRLGPAFVFVDYNGRLGHSPNLKNRPKHQQHWHNIYIFRQMANSYAGTLRTAKRGRKWSNRKLTHLCNSKHLMGSCEETRRLYYGSYDKAYKAHERDKSHDIFFNQTHEVWQVYEEERPF